MIQSRAHFRSMTLTERIEALSMNWKCPHCGAEPHHPCVTMDERATNALHKVRRDMGRRVL